MIRSYKEDRKRLRAFLYYISSLQQFREIKSKRNTTSCVGRVSRESFATTQRKMKKYTPIISSLYNRKKKQRDYVPQKPPTQTKTRPAQPNRTEQSRRKGNRKSNLYLSFLDPPSCRLVLALAHSSSCLPAPSQLRATGFLRLVSLFPVVSAAPASSRHEGVEELSPELLGDAVVGGAFGFAGFFGRVGLGVHFHWYMLALLTLGEREGGDIHRLSFSTSSTSLSLWIS